jgi:hypothetical protein
VQVLVGRAKDAAAANGGEEHGRPPEIQALSPRGTMIRPGQAQHFHNPAPVPEVATDG